MELAGAQSWAYRTWCSSPILRFPLDLFEIWATLFERIEHLKQNEKNNYQNPTSIDRENECLP